MIQPQRRRRPAFYPYINEKGYHYPATVFYGPPNWPSYSEWFVAGQTAEELETPDYKHDATATPKTCRPSAAFESPTT